MRHELLIELLDHVDESLREALADGNYKRVGKLATTAHHLEQLLEDQ